MINLNVIQMNALFTVVGFLGSIASIIGFVMSIIKKDKIRNKILYSVIFVLSAITAYSYHLYRQETDERLRIESRKQEIRLEAQDLLKSYPSYISYYNPGENQGLLYGILVLLEKNKDIFPETYESYKKDVLQKIETSNNEPDMYKKREQMEIAANSAMQFLKSLAQ